MTWDAYKGPTLVTLVDGRIVMSNAEEWRHETEARDLLRLPFDQRESQLEATRAKRPEDADRLIQTMQRLRAVGE